MSSSKKKHSRKASSQDMTSIAETLFRAFESGCMDSGGASDVSLDDDNMTPLEYHPSNNNDYFADACHSSFEPLPIHPNSFHVKKEVGLSSLHSANTAETVVKREEEETVVPPPLLVTKSSSSFVPAILPRMNHVKNQPMGEGFAPGPYDVICGHRGRHALNHVGNRRFKISIQMHAEEYRKAPTKVDKSLIVISIVDSIRRSNPSGHFVKQDKQTKQWIDIGDQQAREKVGHALREAISNHENKSKSAIRANKSSSPTPPSSPSYSKE